VVDQLLILAAALAPCLALGIGDAEESAVPFPSKGDRVEYFAHELSDAWVGRPVDELILIWGQPTKEKRQKNDGRLLVYKMEFPGRFQITPDCFIALSVDGPYPVAGVYHTIPGRPVREILGRLKARFVADPNGIIVEADLLHLKWQKSWGAWAGHTGDELDEAGKPFKTGVEVNPD
jgi:hypothetical protein